MATWWTGVSVHARWHSSLCHQHTPVHQYDCGYFQAVSVYARWPHGGQVCTGDTVLCVISTHLSTNMTVVTSRLSLCMLDGHMVDRWHSSLCHQHTPVHQHNWGYVPAASVYARQPHCGQVCTGDTALCVISTHLSTNMTVVTSRLSLCILDGHMVDRWHSSLCHQHTPVHQYDCGYFQAVSVYARWPHGGQMCTGDTVLCVISTHLYTNMIVVTSRLSLCMLDGHMVDRCVQVTQLSVSSAHTCTPIWLWLLPGCLCVC